MASSPDQPKLTGKRLAFVEAYLGDAQFNATRAAQLAGYAHPGQQGHDLLKKLEIAAAIDRRMAELALTSDIALTLLRQDALRSDTDILDVAASAPGAAAGAAAVSALVSARSTARTNLLKVHGLLSSQVNVRHTGRVDHVHRIPQGLRELSDAELDALAAISAKVHAGEITS